MKSPLSALQRINWKNDYLKIFGLGVLTSFLFFLPFLIQDNGLFLYYGDYNVQQIPFYSLAHDVIRDGQGQWNWYTDLGANFIGSYSFYLLGSPFFWVTLLFPSGAVPYLMAPLLMIKFGLTAVTGFAFIRRFTKTTNTAFLGGLMYAFSGFNLYNIFFNHFQESVLVFPLLLIAMDELIINRQRGGFVLAVALAALVNYYFFFGQVLFCILYFLIRLGMDHKNFSVTLKNFGLLLLEAILGVLLGAALLLPAFLAVMQNSRVSSTVAGYGLYFYNDVQRYGLILSSFFFPPDIPARPNFFPDSNAKWSSVSMFLPLLSTTGVFAFFLGKRKHWAKRLLIICFAACFIPVLNQAFSLFNYSYYARWFYMPLLFMALVSCIALEDHLDKFKTASLMTLGFIAAFAMIGVIPDKSGGEWFSLPKYPERLWFYVIIAVLGLLATDALVRLTPNHKNFRRVSSACLCVLTVATAIFMIYTGKQASGVEVEANGEYTYYNQVVNEGLHGRENLVLDSSEFYRIDTYNEMDNAGMFLRQPTINAFHSIVPTSIVDYYQFIGGERVVASRPATDLVGVRSLTSVKYQLVSDRKNTEPVAGFSLHSTQNGISIYRNNHFIPMGFTYDAYMTDTELQQSGVAEKDEAMLAALYVDSADVAKVSSLLPAASPAELAFTAQRDEVFFDECDERAASAMDTFEIDSEGFLSTGSLSRENYVFFSVPWDEGWSATVNGEEAEILRANVGFMAVRAPAGEVEIRFTYETPGLKAGILISVVALLLFVGYLLLVREYRKKHPEAAYAPNAHREQFQIEDTSAKKKGSKRK